MKERVSGCRQCLAVCCGIRLSSLRRRSYIVVCLSIVPYKLSRYSTPTCLCVLASRPSERAEYLKFRPSCGSVLAVLTTTGNQSIPRRLALHPIPQLSRQISSTRTRIIGFPLAYGTVSSAKRAAIELRSCDPTPELASHFSLDTVQRCKTDLQSSTTVSIAASARCRKKATRPPPLPTVPLEHPTED